MMVRRGNQLLAAGDIVSARRFFERAADKGDAAAACGLGKSYDPLFLRQVGARGVAGDRAQATAWYGRAAAGGYSEAALRLQWLRASYPE
jgi:TPR repeat protein